MQSWGTAPGGGENVLECYDLSGGTALSVIIPFPKLAKMLNRPIQFASFLPAPPPGSGGLTGTLVFTQVDPVGRSFVAQLIGGELGDCTIPATPFWAAKGTFTRCVDAAGHHANANAEPCAMNDAYGMNRRARDRTRIKADDPPEVRYWATILCCTEVDLCTAMKRGRGKRGRRAAVPR